MHRFSRVLTAVFVVCAACGSSKAPPSPSTSSPPPAPGSPPATASDAAAPIAGAVPDAAAAVDVAPPAGTDAIATPGDGAAPRLPAVLIYTRATGFVHDAIGTAATSVGAALKAAGITVDTSADPALFTADGLRRYGGVVLVSTTGKPLGDPGTAALDALAAFVREGGALVGLHAASSTFYDPALPWTPLIGGKFIDHPGSVRNALCHPTGSHPSVAQLPASFQVHDEIYAMDHLNPANSVDLRCDAVGGPPLPIAWHRDEGMGRVFYTALGHDKADWAPDGLLVARHVVPGILWALGR